MEKICTIFQAIEIVGIFPEIWAWKIGLIYGRYLKFRYSHWWNGTHRDNLTEVSIEAAEICVSTSQINIDKPVINRKTM